MRTILSLATLGLSGCIVSGADPCDAPLQGVYDTVVLDDARGQAYLSSEAAAKDCHATFTAQLAYTGDDAFDPTLEMPLVDVSANAIGTGGEQPGLLGILDAWQRIEDPDTQAFTWWAAFDAGAKNVDAPAVIYGMAGVRQPGETRPVSYYAEIDYRPPPEEEPAGSARGPTRYCVSSRSTVWPSL